MRRSLGVNLIALLMLASAACGAKKPPRVQPPLPPPPAPPPLLASVAIAGIGFEWPAVVESLPVSLLLVEPPEPPAPRVASERDRPADAPPLPPLPPPAATPPEPPRLTTPDMPDDAAATRRVREQLDRARRSLGRLRYSRLTDAARAQYDTVLQLIQQAEDALKARSFVFAVKVADKAETLARRLGG